MARALVAYYGPMPKNTPPRKLHDHLVGGEMRAYPDAVSAKTAAIRTVDKVVEALTQEGITDIKRGSASDQHFIWCETLDFKQGRQKLRFFVACSMENSAAVIRTEAL